MPKPADTGPKADKLPIDKMPIEKLAEKLPDTSPLVEVVTPPPVPPSQTGLTGGWTLASGHEPYLYDSDSFVMLGELGAGAEHGYVWTVGELNGDLYVGGWSERYAGGSLISWGAVLARYDPDSGSVTHLIEASAFPESYVSNMKVVGDNIYFILHDEANQSHLGVIDGETDAITYIPFPAEAGSVEGESVAYEAGHIIILNAQSSDVERDILSYDTASGSWSTYDLPGTSQPFWVGQPLTAAGKLFFMGWDSAAGQYSMFEFDVVTGVAQSVAPGVAIATEFPGQAVYRGVGQDEDDWYVVGFDYVAQRAVLLKIEGTSGEVTRVYEASQYFGLSVAADSDNGVYVVESDGIYQKIVKITEDSLQQSSVEIFDIGMAGLGYGQGAIINGSLYLTAYNLDAYRLVSLDEATSTLSSIHDFGTYSPAYILGEVNGYLAVAADVDGDSDLNLWTSQAPSDASSWTMISGEVTVEPWAYNIVLNGDYLFG